MKNNITIEEERISADDYIDFLKRTNLGAQYPKERFYKRKCDSFLRKPWNEKV